MQKFLQGHCTVDLSYVGNYVTVNKVNLMYIVFLNARLTRNTYREQHTHDPFDDSDFTYFPINCATLFVHFNFIFD